MKKRLSLVLGAMLCLGGCSMWHDVMPNWFAEKEKTTSPEAQNWNLANEKNNENLDSDKLGVNPYLWQAALDKLSFMPMASADSKGGVIITDWKQMAVDEEFKVNVTIYTQKLAANGIKVEVFKRVMSKGMWKDATPDKALAEELEKAIILQAKNLYHRDVVTR